MYEDEINKDLEEKKLILKWMVKKDINDVNSVGKMISDYYMDKEKIMKKIK